MYPTLNYIFVTQSALSHFKNSSTVEDGAESCMIYTLSHVTL